ncbi:MAG: NUDIX hydrolase [Alphaproteobacteria bacterium]|nr:NUDIX hydrolase [Alphaproteobacteria bacterium]
MLDLCEVPGDPFTRAHFAPGHFTASAFVLSPDRSALLLIHHKKLGRWLQPGGHVDPEDPDLCAAARREAAEETGQRDLPAAVPGIFDVDIHDIPPLKGEPAHQHFDVRFLFQATSRAVTQTDEVAGVRWVPLEQVSLAESDESVMRAVRKIRRL